MFFDEIQQLLSRLHAGVAQSVSLRCACENLETVYVHLADHGGVRVDDDHRTFQYLDRADDKTYIPADALDLVAVRRAIKEIGCDLVESHDEYPIIECSLQSEQSVADAVDCVARAIDIVFKLALRPDLR